MRPEGPAVHPNNRRMVERRVYFSMWFPFGFVLFKIPLGKRRHRGCWCNMGEVPSSQYCKFQMSYVAWQLFSRIGKPGLRASVGFLTSPA